jgi:hypothetical protein
MTDILNPDEIREVANDTRPSELGGKHYGKVRAALLAHADLIERVGSDELEEQVGVQLYRLLVNHGVDEFGSLVVADVRSRILAAIRGES